VCTRACWNATHALGAPSGQFGSGWHGQGTVHDRSGAWASRGIERWGDGEVTAREGVGGVLTKRGVHGGNGDVHGRRRGSAAGHCGVGSSEVVSRGGARSLGGW
jgi:hypothetical protein